MAWALSDIRTKFRSLTSRPETAQISDDEIDVFINDFMQFHLPFEVKLSSMEADWTQETSAVDNGDYDIAEADIDLNEPITANGDALTIYYSKREFFNKYPLYRNEKYITSPTLAIGTTSAAAVLNSAFKYQISGWTYSKASTETDLSGDTVPQNKYGAWLLSIDEDGTITVTEADDNATGYDTVALAVNGLPTVSDCVMGYVTAISTDSGGFVPGTTELSASAVTDTYADGNPILRTAPNDVCVAGGKLHIRPKCNDIYLIRAHQSLARPDELSGDDSVPVDLILGSYIAMGAAIDFLSGVKELIQRDKLIGNSNAPGTFLYLQIIINRKWYFQQRGRVTMPSF